MPLKHHGLKFQLSWSFIFNEKMIEAIFESKSVKERESMSRVVAVAVIF
jgi:hypothetical protein